MESAIKQLRKSGERSSGIKPFHSWLVCWSSNGTAESNKVPTIVKFTGENDLIFEYFFAKYVYIMRVSPTSCTVELQFLWRKISCVVLCWGTWLRTHYWRIEGEEKKPSIWQGFEPTTLRVLLCRRVLDRYATTTARKLFNFRLKVQWT